MTDQQGLHFDPAQHHQPPPGMQFRDGLAQEAPAPARPAQQQRWTPQPIEDVQPQMVAMAKAVSRIVATRMLLLLAVVTASAVWAYAVYDPSQLRILAGGAYSALVVWPLTWLYWQKG